MQAREIIRIPAAGTPGAHGSGPGDFPFRPLEAPFGCDGQHGQSATAPTAGTAAQNIHVRLNYMETDPAIVQVAGEGAWTGKLWKVSRDQELSLDCKGGDGGRGGRGQDGQQGGRGGTGRDATKYRDAEDGGMGGRGGDGGHGSNGANGGDAGNVFMTVSEDDLDLLIACTWDTTGGSGGPSGTHGMPGDGGIGGTGGNGCQWTERKGDAVIQCSRPAGRPGHQGPPGSQPGTYLSGGNTGKQGSTQIRVLKKDLTEATYPGRYELEVVSFDVIDENEDGVNEPGEHLLVRNIKVRNKGSMPSPGSANPISVLIQGTHWLQPIASEPVEIPFSVLPGDVVSVPGTLKAYIRNETSIRAPGVPLRAEDRVTLIATFHKRLNRSLPGFSGSTPYNIGYPLELTAPRCLDCVQKGDRVRFSWTLRNVSTKPYGAAVQNHVARYTASKFSDPGQIFELPYSDKENERPHEAIDPLDELLPGDEVPIEQDFIVSPTAKEYTNAELHLELLLADPFVKEASGEAKIRSVMKYDIKMQIAGVYKYDPKSRYLLVVNSKTPNWGIHQIINFVRNELHLGLDIWNLSLTGSYNDAASGKSVLQGYSGKSIIIYGNGFPYFDRGLRSPWQLLDWWEVCSLAKGGTGFLFFGVDNDANLRQWAMNMAFPATASGNLLGESDSAMLKDVLKGLQNEDATSASTNIPLRQFKGKKSFGEAATSCFMSSSPDKCAQKGAKKLNKALPLRRFLVVPDANSPDPKAPNIFLIEGLPKTTTVLGTTIAAVPSPTDVLHDHHKYAIIGCLPFGDLSRLFWNAWGASQADANGALWFPAPSFYRNLGWEETQDLVWQSVLLEPKIIRFICLSIQTQIGTEITRFLAGKAPSKESLKQLPLLSRFLNTPQGVGAGSLQQLPEQEIVVGLLGSILGALLTVGFSQWIQKTLSISQKSKLYTQANDGLRLALSNVCTTAVATSVHKSILVESQKVKKEIKSHGGNKDLSLVTYNKQTQLTQIDAGFIALAGLNPASVAVTASALQNMKDGHDGRANARDGDVKEAAIVLARHVNPEVEDD